MDDSDSFELSTFTPFLLNQAAEAQSDVFSPNYRDRYGMLRTEWRVLFHLGRYGNLSAKEISDRASIHKTKVSRAVRALEEKRFLARATSPEDRRSERLSLRPPGEEAFRVLTGAAQDYEAALVRKLGRRDTQKLKDLLLKLQD
ncbi:MarR family transcriptional regulator [Salipiger marinus]|jgi:DNA-binding MarR family transcriptional regulator|uniref:Transcriptional regulator, MarR family n=1 Tax=Salipiger marinus TaxID=555512 RepID=A0A1G8K4D2_9RHOB|nr:MULTISPECIES: MarR family transcriptional regulator [Salipiger]MCD1618758.1 MarR family transcriptional regulator [Salipiger manganoxidans]MEB3417802.1 MarR family transcriptional regulator [Salipiger manganoxidans]SDI38209.1 transcriptional regulator, MarR family [Salipiger marinus]HBS98994.1 MarR family transcriptional regulator [Citreicella sp.]